MKLLLSSGCRLCSTESFFFKCEQVFSLSGLESERFLIAQISVWKGVTYIKEVGGGIALQEFIRDS